MEQIKNKRTYNEDFKKTVVELYYTCSVRTLSSKYGESEVMIYKWIKALTPVEGVSNSLRQIVKKGITFSYPS